MEETGVTGEKNPLTPSHLQLSNIPRLENPKVVWRPNSNENGHIC